MNIVKAEFLGDYRTYIYFSDDTILQLPLTIYKDTTLSTVNLSYFKPSVLTEEILSGAKLRTLFIRLGICMKGGLSKVII